MNFISIEWGYKLLLVYLWTILDKQSASDSIHIEKKKGKVRTLEYTSYVHSNNHRHHHHHHHRCLSSIEHLIVSVSFLFSFCSTLSLLPKQSYEYTNILVMYQSPMNDRIVHELGTIDKLRSRHHWVRLLLSFLLSFMPVLS
jgi:hypothetical protein